MEVDRHSTMKVFFLLEDPAFTADDETPEIDLGDSAEGDRAESLEYIVTIGAIAVAGGTIEARCQESDTTGGPWTDVATTEVLGGEDLTTEAGNGLVIPIAAVNAAYRLGCISKKQFQRLALTEEAAVTAGQISVCAILQDFRHDPQDDQSS